MKTTDNKNFISLATPLIIQSVVTAVISATDSIMLGMTGQAALSAITLAGQIVIIYNNLIIAICVGATALSSQYYGNNDILSVRKVLAITLQISSVAGTLFALAVFLLPGPIMSVYTNDPELIGLGISYLRIIAPTFLLMSVSQSFINLMKNTGWEKVSSVIGGSVAILNIVLDALLIFGLYGFPKMGVKGAALATLTTRSVEFALTLICIGIQKTVRFKVTDFFHWYKALMQKYLRYTLPAAFNKLSWFISNSLAVGILGHLGSDVTAASSVALIVFNISSSVVNGYSAAVGITVGHMLGNNELDKAKKTTSEMLKRAVVLAAIIGIIICLSVPAIKKAYVNLTPSAQNYLSFMLFFVAFKLLGKFFNSTLVNGVFSIGGDVRYVMKQDIFEMWCVVLPLGLLSAYAFNMPPLVTYVVLNLEEVYKIYFMFRHYRKYVWVKNLTKKEWAGGSRYINEIRCKIFEEMPLGVMVIGNSGKVSLCNNACAALLGSSVDEVEGSNYQQLFAQDDENAELADVIITAVADKQTKHEKIVDFYRNKSKCRIKVCTGFIEDEDSKFGVFLTMQQEI